MKKLKIGICGAGKIGESIAAGILKNKKSFKSELEITASTKSAASAKEVEKTLGIQCLTNNKKLAATCDIIILAVKPYQAKAALKEMAPELKKGKLLISICASITSEELSLWSGKKASIVRAMTNTPCLINEGMTAIAGGPNSTEEQISTAENIFNFLGLTVRVEESLLDAVTGLSGSGPAYIYLMLEAMSEGGVKVGLPRKTATILAAQTMLGAAKMVLQLDTHPAALKDEVTTPAGCTIDGLMALEDGGLRSTLIKAVVAATKRSRTLNQ